MLLSLGIFLAFGFTWVEVQAVNASTFIEHIYTKGIWKIPGVWINLVGSFCLSGVVGHFFPAAGLTVLFAAVLSTMMSNMYFKVDPQRKKAMIVVHRQHEVAKEFYDNNRSVINEAYQGVVAGIKTVVTIIGVALYIIGAPLRVYRWCKAQHQRFFPNKEAATT